MNYKPFKPAFGLANRHFQTLYSALFVKDLQLEIEIEQFELDDGDFLECTWHHKAKANRNKPIVALFHGLAGSYKSAYIQGIMRALGREDFSVVLMHFRGCSGKQNRLPRAYHSGDTYDAKLLLGHLRKSYPDSLLFAVGYSLGGNMLLKMLGEYGISSPLSAAVSVSAPMQLEVGANQMNRGFSKFYQAYLIEDLKKSLLEKYKLHDMKSFINIDEEGVKKLNTFWEFDNAYTAPIHGFSSADDYYAKSSAKQFLNYIQTDTLIIQALDDPFMTQAVLPREGQYSKKVKLETHPHGGHVGFIGGTIFKPEFYLEKRILSYFKQFI
jgi:uncharacterized protein